MKALVRVAAPPELLSRARALLAEAKTLGDVLKVRNIAQAAAQYFKGAHQSRTLAKDAAEVRLRAERKAGSMLDQMRKRGERASKGGDQRSSNSVLLDRLSDLGVTKMQSHRWQEIARILEPVFEEYIAAGRNSEADELTTAGLLNAAEGGGGPPIDVHYSSASPEWYTPAAIVDRAVTLLGEIDLDPCSNPGAPTIPARVRYTQVEDGLAQRWEGRVYMNPPYGRPIQEWVGKLVTEYAEGNVCEAVALVPARVDTDWFNRFRDYAVCFIRGRLQFSGHENSAPFPSAVVYLGERRGAFYGAFSDLGDVWVRWNGQGE